MGTFSSVEEAKEYFKGDKFASESGIELTDLSENCCVCRMELRPDHLNANGGVMGGAIFTLADFAFAVTANNIHLPTVAQQISINYLNAPKGKTLIATAKCRKSGRSSTIINVDIADETGCDIVQFTGTGFKL